MNAAIAERDVGTDSMHRESAVAECHGHSRLVLEERHSYGPEEFFSWIPADDFGFVGVNSLHASRGGASCPTIPRTGFVRVRIGHGSAVVVKGPYYNVVTGRGWGRVMYGYV